MNYVLFSSDFTANSTATTLRFKSLSPPASVGGIALDAVSVTKTAVPEPSALCLMGFGVVSLAGRRSRRKRA